MSKRSTAYRLSIYISAAIISVLVAFISILYNKSKSITQENTELQAINVSLEVISQVEELVKSTQEIARNTAELIPYFAIKDDIGKLIQAMVSNYPFINTINVELKEGVLPVKNIYYHTFCDNDGLVHYQNNTLSHVNSIEREAIRCFSETATKGWTEPFRCPVHGTVVSTYCIPINIKQGKNTVHAGTLSIGLSLTFLNEKIKGIKMGEKGFVFLVSGDGTFVAHPVEDWILSRNIFTVSDSVYKEDRQILREKLNSGVSGFTVAYPEMLDYQKSWVYYAPIPENNWDLIFVMPYAELYRASRLILFQMVLISLAGLLLIFFLVTIISQKLMNPIAQIAAEIHDFSTSGRVKNLKNEVKALENSMSLIQTWYKRFQAQQEKSRQSDKQYKRDLEQAYEIQQNIIPDSVPVFPGNDEIEIFSAFKPARLVGGDLYDYFMIDNNHLLVTIGDVSGKGISAAIFMGVANTLLKSNTSGKNAKQIINEVNNGLYSRNQNQYFLTLFVAVINLKTGEFNYCNAAHTTSFILKTDGSIVELNKTHGLPLGLYNNKNYGESIANLSKNDSLILYTDGVTEMVDVNNNFYGEARFKEELIRLNAKAPKEIITEVEKSLKEFRQGTKQSDDYSIVALKYLPK